MQTPPQTETKKEIYLMSCAEKSDENVANAQVLQRFCWKLNPLPDGLEPEISSSEYGCALFFLCSEDNTERANNNRLRLLAFVGELLGADGWEATISYRGKSFDWTKTIDGVKVSIFNAQLIERQESFPVPPSSFPLQLNNVIEA